MRQDEIRRFREQGSWRSLLALAQEMVTDAERHSGGVALSPQLGGGTRLMLALDHRISNDIDLFIRDPQWIGFLTPRLNDRFESQLKGYEEDATWLKLRHPQGEIDFIVGMSLLGLPGESDPTVPFPLEPVAEVIAKKLFYRGWELTPRDLFDWKSVCEDPRYANVPALMRNLLGEDKRSSIEAALKNSAVSQTAAARWNAIQAAEKSSLQEAVAWGMRQLEEMGRDRHPNS
ncbi:MAG: nucleotidyl transferase AbiEii/AbiGii toxin family protein [Acetobacteraceae bacterium]